MAPGLASGFASVGGAGGFVAPSRAVFASAYGANQLQMISPRNGPGSNGSGSFNGAGGGIPQAMVIPPSVAANVQALSLTHEPPQSVEALARLYGTTLNSALARCVTICFDGALSNARDALHSPYAADRTVAKENLDVLNGATKNTARNLRGR